MAPEERSFSRIEAVIFDMDGVITDTASAHAAAWKRTFDAYLSRRAKVTGETLVPFDVVTDYRRHVDGKPRYRGVRDFLNARGICLAFGGPDDPADRETVCGLGNRKNAHFRQWLASNRVDTFASSLALLNALREKGVRTAVYSASRNAEAVLASAGLSDCFDVKVDGLDRDRLHLQGKPYPDVILEAIARLGVDARCSVIVDDAIAGVEAARRAAPAQVVGINRGDYAHALLAEGADIVVNDLGEVRFDPATGLSAKTLNGLAAPWDDLAGLRRRLRGKRLAVFLDYDGTLTPIVDDPTRAILGEDMRRTVRALAQHVTVAVISGRDLAEVRRLVAVDALYYAGSHGFDIAGPRGRGDAAQVGGEFLPDLDRAERDLRDRLRRLAGVLIERKRFAISVHYRHVREADLPAVEAAVDRVTAPEGRLRKSHGKKVFQIQPRLRWNKGQAVLWLLAQLERREAAVAPIYIGDDLTDEDAFRVVLRSGLGIAVGDGVRLTAAEYAVAGPSEVKRFLELLIAMTTGDPP